MTAARGPDRPHVLAARWVVVDPSRVLEGAGLVVSGGRVLDVLRRPEDAVGVERVDLGDGVLAPGLVDAHAHLELGGLTSRPSAGESFDAWVRELVALRAGAGPADLERGAREGAARLLRTGATAVGDIDSTGAGARGLSRIPLRARTYREVYDLDEPERRADALSRLAEPARESALRRAGLSPHAPYTVGPSLLAACARTARERALPVTVHWAETPEEREWLERGSGPFAGLLPGSPLRSGLDLLEEAGLLSPRTSLVHGNDPTPDELVRIARSGCTLVHCPGTHAWFDRPPFPLELYRERGIPVALGTDSLASNEDLDLSREMSLLRAAHPELAPAEVLEAATLHGARALGLAGEIGALSPGHRADGVFFQLEARDVEAVLEGLTRGAGRIAAVWVGGEPLPQLPEPPERDEVRA